MTSLNQYYTVNCIRIGRAEHHLYRMLSATARRSAGLYLSSAGSRRGFFATATAAADAVVEQASSAFLKFGNPVPSDVGMNQQLAHLPETKVREWNRM